LIAIEHPDLDCWTAWKASAGVNLAMPGPGVAKLTNCGGMDDILSLLSGRERHSDLNPDLIEIQIEIEPRK